MRNGWISLNRKILYNEMWNKEPFTPAQAFIHLLLLANYEDNCEIKRGQLVVSQYKLSLTFKWSRGKLRHFLNNLQKDKSATITTTHKGTHITICNYDSYQKQQPTESPINDPVSNPQKDTINNTNNLNKEISKTKENNNTFIFSNFMRGTIYVSQMKKPLTQKETERLLDVYGIELLTKVTESLEANKCKNKSGRKYIDAYKTLNNWCQNNKETTDGKSEREQSEGIKQLNSIISGGV